MNAFFKSLRKDSVLQWSFWVTIFFVLLTAGVIILSYTNLPPVVPLYNHMPWGYARLGKTYELFILPLVVLVICIGNSVLGIQLISKNPLLARFLFLTMSSVSLFTFIFIVRLILVTL